MRRAGGFTLVEVMLGMMIGASTVIFTIAITQPFFSGRLPTRMLMANRTAMMTQMLVPVQARLSQSSRAYLFHGRVLQADGEQYKGEALSLTNPAYSITNGADLLAEANLTLEAPASGSMETVIVIGDTFPFADVLVLTTVPQSDGYTEVKFSCSFEGTASSAIFAYPSSVSPQSAAVLGGSVVETDTQITINLPTPNAVPATQSPGTPPLCSISFPTPWFQSL